MNELRAIVDAYAEARARGGRTALATVVGVEGSAYRRPGARMLITEGGQTTGTISGGCLERDAVERAARVMETGAARVVVYDTRGDEDVVWGLGLGCNGVVRVLLESLHEGGDGARALQFIADCLRSRRRGVAATVVGHTRAPGGAGGGFRIGARFFLDGDDLSHCGLDGGGLNLRDREQPLGEFSGRVREDARKALADGRTLVRRYGADEGVEVFFDVIEPPRPLLIFGAEQDALPLVRLARTLGWHTTVVDTRARGATRGRFAEADDVILCPAEDVSARLRLTPGAAAVLMTHNYLHDVELLRALLPAPLSYLGVLGPKERTRKLLEELRAQGEACSGPWPARLHSPAGVDIGAETPEEIALSIVAEIGAVCAGRRAGFLRDRGAPIHDDRGATAAATEVPFEPRQVAARESASVMACRSS
jgi:xanthine/CO dehydrogenase XdhC/CoxF family maturation factor